MSADRRLIRLDRLTVDVPSDWSDISQSLGTGAHPFTLARKNGRGALQFSIALYTSGPVPDPTAEDLCEMLTEFGAAHKLGPHTEVATRSLPLRVAAASFHARGDFIRVWQISDGRNFALATYLCTENDQEDELPICEEIIGTIRFDPAADVTPSEAQSR